MSAATPDIASLLATLGGGGGGQTGMPIAPPQNGGGPGGQTDAAVPDLLQQAIDALHQAFAAETEPIDKQMIAAALKAVQDILAQEQKEKDQAMGGSGARIIRRNR